MKQLHKKFGLLIATIVSVLGLAGLVAVTGPSQAAFAQDCTGAKNCANKGLNDTGAATGDIPGLVKSILNILSYIVGIASVIMILIGGFRYVASGGDAGQIQSAKNTIIYAIVGLVIAIFAQAIVKFVIGKL